MAHEGVPLIVIQRQLGHSNLGITSIYLQDIDSAGIIKPCTASEHRSSRSTRRCDSEDAWQRRRSSRKASESCPFPETSTGRFARQGSRGV